MTTTIYDHVKLQWVTAFAELDKIRSFDDPTLPEEDLGNQNLDSNEKPAILGPVLDAPRRPPFIRKKARSANALLPPPHTLPPTLNNQRLPQLTSVRRRPSGSESNNDDERSSASDFGAAGHASRSRPFERSLTETRLDLETKRMRSDDDMSSKSSTTRPPRVTLPELSPQQVLLPIPSIYLNPDLTGAHEAERAARRRLRHNAKLIQRLRGITF